MSFRHLGINAVFLRPKMGGLEAYTKQLLPALMRLRPEMRVSIFVSPEGAPVVAAEPWAGAVDVVTHRLLGVPGTKALAEAAVVGPLASRRGVDVLHSVAMTGPLATRAASVVTLADVIWIKEADPSERVTVAVWKALVPPAARRADRVIAISRSGADDVVDHLRVPRERIDVIYPGVRFGERPAPTPEAELRERLGLGPGPLVLTVSQKRVHKNLMRLVRAMAGVRERVPGAVLAIPGNPTPHEEELKAEAARLGLTDAIAFPAYVSAEDLEGLYAAARCFTVASTNEGFGIPVLEAQHRGVPIALSRAAALPEAGGPGAHYFDPYDERDMARAIADVLADRDLAGRLVEAGRSHHGQFTWERAAEQTLESYDRAWHARRRD